VAQYTALNRQSCLCVNCNGSVFAPHRMYLCTDNSEAAYSAKVNLKFDPESGHGWTDVQDAIHQPTLLLVTCASCVNAPKNWSSKMKLAYLHGHLPIAYCMILSFANGTSFSRPRPMLRINAVSPV